MKKNGAVIIIVIVAVLALSILGVALLAGGSDFYSGKGTEKKPFKISSVEDLRQLSKDVNEGKTYEGVYFALGKDIDAKGAELIPIGSRTKKFLGNFDGANRTISNFRIRGEYEYAGLFGYVDGHIKNLTVKGAAVEADNMDTRAYVGGLAGYFLNGSIVNCKALDMDVAAESFNGDSYSYVSDIFIGGLVGYNYNGRITGCETSGEVFASADSLYEYPSYTNDLAAIGRGVKIGGIAGFSERGAVIENCKSSCLIEADAPVTYAYVGGIAGVNDNSTIINCGTEGEVIAYAYYIYAGGVAGISQTWENTRGDAARITGSYSLSDVRVNAYCRTNSSNIYAGGIAGGNRGSELSRCYADGIVYASGQADSYSCYVYAGGLIGSNAVYGTGENAIAGAVKNCYTLGKVSAAAEAESSANAYAGGLIGENTSVSSGDNRIGGAVENCYSAAEVSASAETVAQTNNPYSSAYAGGLIANNQYCYVRNCFAVGKVNGKAVVPKPAEGKNTYAYAYIGGFVSSTYNNTYIVNCYRYIDQNVTAEVIKGDDINTTGTLNTAGTTKEYSELEALTFYIDTLDWNGSIWNFTAVNFAAKIYPALR